jgi:ubiquinone/menaquinone biosynthesis C-methylase UbiE
MVKHNYDVHIWKEHVEKYEDYWNDEKIESVSNNISKGEYLALEKHIREQGFILDFENCLSILEKRGKKISGTGSELASGTMWLTAHIIKNFNNQIHQFYSVDYSERYVMHLGKKLLDHYRIEPDKLTLCLGSFYEVKLPPESLDFIVLCQAFHHADDPDKLLKEAYRLLKKEGFLIMIGELYIPIPLYTKCYLNYLMSRVVLWKHFPDFLIKRFKILKKMRSKKLTRSFQEVYFPPDPKTGDHYHLRSQYKSFFLRNKFKFVNVKSTCSNHLAYVIFKT